MGLLHGPKRRSHRKRIRVKDEDINFWITYFFLAAVTAALAVTMHFGVPEWLVSPPQISDSMSSVQPF